MEKHEIIATIKDILKDSLKDTIVVDEIGAETNLIEEIRLDSIQAMEILLQVEEKFDIMIDDDDLNKALFSSMSSLSDYIMKKLQ